MFAPTSSENKTAKKFRSKLNPHLPRDNGLPRLLRLKKCPDSKKTVGEAVFIPENDVIHVFDNEMMLAVSHAIEDLASEVREGELIATFQSFANFLPSRKRYISLARDLDAVRVWGAGPVPKACPGIDFIVCENSRFMRYWLVVFESKNDHAVMVCKQINEATDPAKKQFVGFYSFSSYLVQSIRWRFNLISSGLNTVVKHWEDSFSLPEVKAKEIGALLDGIAAQRPVEAKKAAAKAKPKAKAKAPVKKAKAAKPARRAKVAARPAAKSSKSRSARR